MNRIDKQHNRKKSFRILTAVILMLFCFGNVFSPAIPRAYAAEIGNMYDLTMTSVTDFQVSQSGEDLTFSGKVHNVPFSVTGNNCL